MITDKIFELKQIKESKSLLLEREVLLAKPRLKNINYLKGIYEIINRECSNNSRLSKYEIKYYFVAIASVLYSPRVFMGETFERGVRDEMSKVLMFSPGYISNTIKTVRDWFVLYKEFRDNIEYLYNKVLQEIPYMDNEL